MQDREMKTAKRFGVYDRIAEFEKKLLEVDHVVDVEFDLSGFYDDIRQVVFLPKYDIPASEPNYFEVRKAMLRQVLDVAASFGLKSSGDAIEDYGAHYYIVRSCDDSWVLQYQPLVSMDTNIKQWYTKTYPTDEVGATLDSDVTFAMVNAALKKYKDVYDVLGGDADSIVRERVFNQLAELRGVDYDVIYNQWLTADPKVVELIEHMAHEVVGTYDWTMPKYDANEYDNYNDYDSDCLDIGHERRAEICGKVIEQLKDCSAIKPGDETYYEIIDELVWEEITNCICKKQDPEQKIEYVEWIGNVYEVYEVGDTWVSLMDGYGELLKFPKAEFDKLRKLDVSDISRSVDNIVADAVDRSKETENDNSEKDINFVK